MRRCAVLEILTYLSSFRFFTRYAPSLTTLATLSITKIFFPAVPSLQSNDFELFDVPVQFAQDNVVLDSRWKELQREAHPDKFAMQGSAAQRLAMQWSVRINEAHQRLKNPLRRATYLCELHGAPIKAESNTAMPADFLIQQMQWREALDDAKGLEGFEEIANQADYSKREQLSKIEHLLDDAKDFAAAAKQVRALMFIERFGSEVDARIDSLGQ